MDEKKIETFDKERGVGILSGKPPLEVKAGPRRRAPMYYAGETYGRRRLGRTGQKTRGRAIQYPDVERYANGALASKRDKAARRIIRGALKRSFSKVEKALKLPRAMLAQARELANDQGRKIIGGVNDERPSSSFRTRWARRLYASELAIHDPVYAPSQKELRALRTARRKLKRHGKQDAIGQLVDKMTGAR